MPRRAGAGKAVHKSDLPTKTCVSCRRPFSWRKKMGTGLGRGEILFGPLPPAALIPQIQNYRIAIILLIASRSGELSLFDDIISLILLVLIFFR